MNLAIVDRKKITGYLVVGHFEVLWFRQSVYDPRSYTKRHETRAFFVLFRVTSWIVPFVVAKESAL